MARISQVCRAGRIFGVLILQIHKYLTDLARVVLIIRSAESVRLPFVPAGSPDAAKGGAMPERSVYRNLWYG